MTGTPDITPGVRTRQLLDDLLWLRTGVVWDRQDAVDKMLADYTTDPDHYSNGTPVEEQYDPAALDPSGPSQFWLTTCPSLVRARWTLARMDSAVAVQT